jgi:hypothetical protein
VSNPGVDFLHLTKSRWNHSFTDVKTGNMKFRVLISGIRSTGFDSDTIYEYRVYFRLYS